MNLYRTHEPSHHSIFAFIAGVTTATLVGGYFLFGPKGREHRRNVDRWIKRARFEILDRIEAIEDITEQQYHTIVDDVTYRYGQLKGVGQEKIEQAREYFRARWHEMRVAATQAREEARRELEEEKQRQRILTGSTPNEHDPSRYL